LPISVPGIGNREFGFTILSRAGTSPAQRLSVLVKGSGSLVSIGWPGDRLRHPVCSPDRVSKSDPVGRRGLPGVDREIRPWSRVLHHESATARRTGGGRTFHVNSTAGHRSGSDRPVTAPAARVYAPMPQLAQWGQDGPVPLPA